MVEGIMSKRICHSGVVLGLSAMLSACTVGPNFKAPHANLPQTWGQQATNTRSQTYGGQVDAVWWNSFHDPELTSLVGRLARQNFDLAMATQRVTQGQEERNAAASEGLPHFGVMAGYTRTHQSPQGFLKLVEPRPGSPVEYDFFEDAAMASWELDLFGRVRRTVEMERANTAVVEEERHAIALEAVSDLALNYMQLRTIQRKIAIVQQNIDLAAHDVALVRNQIAYGTGNQLDLAEAEELETSIRATLPGLKTIQAHLVNAISFLLAEPPRALEAELMRPAVQAALPPAVPTGLPSELARRRPDIREAEAKLHAATAETGVAVASFYPDLSLSGRFGMQALRFSDVFNMGSRAAAIGPALDIPIFEGGRLRAQLHLRKSQQKEAAIAYQKTVLKAWHEVDDAMVAYHNVQETHQEQTETLTHAQKALDVARQRYADGTEDFLNVITAQRAYLETESDLVGTTGETQSSLVHLYKALGGGWQYSEGGNLR